MRIVIIALMLLPFWSAAQINRSANELANEKVLGFLSAKIFKGQSFLSVSHGLLKSFKGLDENIAWSIVYKLLSDAPMGQVSGNSKDPFYFIFYLDKKLNVLLAESFNKTEDQETAGIKSPGK